MKRTLVLMRHAEAGNAPGRTDRDRPLTPAGRRAAAGAGAWLRRRGLDPQLILCSAAVRTTETAAGLGFPDAAVWPERELYLAGSEELLQRIQVVDDTVGVLTVVGHNPGVHQLVLRLGADRSGDSHFPPAAVAVLRVAADSWSRLHPDRATVVALERRPR